MLKSKGARELFQQSSKGKKYTLEELRSNLEQVLKLKVDAPSETAEKNVPHVRSQEERSKLIGECKQEMFKKVREDRHKILIEKQKDKLPAFLKTPKDLIGKKVKHKCYVDVNGKRETLWYDAVVDLIRDSAEIPLKREYYLIYDDDEEDVYWHFPLLMDLKKGDLIID